MTLYRDAHYRRTVNPAGGSLAPQGFSIADDFPIDLVPAALTVGRDCDTERREPVPLIVAMAEIAPTLAELPDGICLTCHRPAAALLCTVCLPIAQRGTDRLRAELAALAERAGRADVVAAL